MKKGYKLFEMNEHGELYSLFIDKNTPVPVGQWLHAKFCPTKDFAPRGGWHIGTVPDAAWLKAYDGTEKGYYKPRWKKGKRVWGEVEYNTHNNYNDYVRTLPRKAIIDGIPEDGYYFFREAGKGIWVITSDIKITRIITEEERQEILRSMEYNEADEYARYKCTFEKRMKTIVKGR